MSEDGSITFIHLCIIIHTGNKNVDFDGFAQVTTSTLQNTLKVPKGLDLILFYKKIKRISPQRE